MAFSIPVTCDSNVERQLWLISLKDILATGSAETQCEDAAQLCHANLADMAQFITARNDIAAAVADSRDLKRSVGSQLTEDFCETLESRVRDLFAGSHEAASSECAVAAPHPACAICTVSCLRGTSEIMDIVISHAVSNVKAGGGPFAAAIVHNGTIVSLEANSVTRTNDPTAHAEVCAIRAACTTLSTFQLEECELYTSCFPCPMCCGAAYWARVKVLHYAATAADAASVGFDDAFIYEEMRVAEADRKIPFRQITPGPARLAPFEAWTANVARTHY